MRWAAAVSVAIVAVFAIVTGGVALSDHAAVSRQGHVIAQQARKITELHGRTGLLARQLTATQAQLTRIGGKPGHGQLGVCVDYNAPGSDSAGDTFSYEDIASPVFRNGVTSCPFGTFISVLAGR